MPRRLQDDPDALAQRRAAAAPGSWPSTETIAAACARGSPRGSRPSSSCPRRWARAGRRPRRGRRRSRCRGPPRARRRTCAGRARRMARAARSRHHDDYRPGSPLRIVTRMRCACIDIGSNTTRLLVAEPDARRPPARGRSPQRAFTRLGSRLGAGGAIPPAKVARGRRGRRRRAGRRRPRRGRRRDPRRGHRGASAARREPRRADAPRCAQRRASTVRGARAARTRRGWRSSAPPARSRRLPDGRVGVVDVGGGSTEIVGGTRDGGVAWSALAAGRLGAAGRRPPARRPADAAELDAVRAHVAGVLAALRAAAAPSRPRGRRQRDVAARGCVGAGARRGGARARAGPRCAARRPPSVAARARARTPSACACCPPGSWCSSGRRGALGDAAADRRAAACARA